MIQRKVKSPKIKSKTNVTKKSSSSVKTTINEADYNKTNNHINKKTTSSIKKNKNESLSFLKIAEKPLNILVACEESQAVTIELRKLGHNAYSCDLLECSGGEPKYHFRMDVFEVINIKGLKTQSGHQINNIEQWDIMIAHPPCTYLAVSGARWLHDPRPKYKDRAKMQLEAIDFVNKLWNCGIDNIVIENPVGVLSTHEKSELHNKKIAAQKKENVHKQIIQPYFFGEPEEKRTCFWIKGLKPLEKTNEVKPKARWVSKSSGKTMPLWYAEAIKAKTAEERRTLRSKTFQKVAQQMAEQWAGKVIKSKKKK